MLLPKIFLSCISSPVFVKPSDDSFVMEMFGYESRSGYFFIMIESAARMKNSFGETTNPVSESLKKFPFSSSIRQPPMFIESFEIFWNSTNSLLSVSGSNNISFITIAFLLMFWFGRRFSAPAEFPFTASEVIQLRLSTAPLMCSIEKPFLPAQEDL